MLCSDQNNFVSSPFWLSYGNPRSSPLLDAAFHLRLSTAKLAVGRKPAENVRLCAVRLQIKRCMRARADRVSPGNNIEVLSLDRFSQMKTEVTC